MSLNSFFTRAWTHSNYNPTSGNQGVGIGTHRPQHSAYPGPAMSIACRLCSIQRSLLPALPFLLSISSIPFVRTIYRGEANDGGADLYPPPSPSSASLDCLAWILDHSSRKETGLLSNERMERQSILGILISSSDYVSDANSSSVSFNQPSIWL